MWEFLPFSCGRLQLCLGVSWGITRFRNVPVQLLIGGVGKKSSFDIQSASCSRFKTFSAKPRFATLDTRISVLLTVWGSFVSTLSIFSHALWITVSKEFSQATSATVSAKKPSEVWKSCICTRWAGYPPAATIVRAPGDCSSHALNAFPNDWMVCCPRLIR